MHFNTKSEFCTILMKLSNSGLQKPLRSSKFRIFLEALTLANFYQISMFSQKDNQNCFSPSQKKEKVEL